MQSIINAKIEAVDALTEALRTGINSGTIQSLAGVETFLSTWTAGVRSVTVSTTGAPIGSEPTDEIGTKPGAQILDGQGDVWTLAPDGRWTLGRLMQRSGDYTLDYIKDHFGRVTPR